MRKKGQALVEFIIILPIFLLIVLGIIDIGNIIISKINLNSDMSEVINYYKNGKSVNEIKEKLNFKKNYDLKIDKEEEYINFEITKEVDIITPGLQFVFDNPYNVIIKRSILNE